MATFVVRIEADNAAFEGELYGEELARMFKIVAKRVENGVVEGLIEDANGNTCGEHKMEVTR